jgi:hypothetical protein
LAVLRLITSSYLVGACTQKCPVTRLCHRVVRRKRIEHPDAAHSALLRPRRERPRGCRAAERRDELDAFSLDYLVGELLKLHRHVQAE